MLGITWLGEHWSGASLTFSRLQTYSWELTQPKLASDLGSAATACIPVVIGSIDITGRAALLGGGLFMDASIISALSAVSGTAVGAFASVVANWLNHRNQIRAQWLQHEKNRRQVLYRDFIEEASKCYIDALQHDEADVSALVGLYAKLSRMRVLSSETVVQSADTICRKILDTYLGPDKSFVELRDMANNGTIDLLQEFSIACREEFEEMWARQF